MELPASVGKYELIELLGVSPGDVYRGRDTVTGRPVLMKILSAGAGSEAKELFLQESRKASGMGRDDDANVFECGEFEGRPYLAMEYPGVENLREMVRNGRAGTLHRRLKLALQAAEQVRSVQGRAARVGLLPAGNTAIPLVDVPAFGTLLIELLEGAGAPPAVRDLALRCTAAKESERPGFEELIKGLREGIASGIRVPINPGPTLIRLSIIVYSAVALVTGLAVYMWFHFQPPVQVEGMIYIPAGTFLAGPDKHAETLKAFYVDATEVTNAEYSRFCRATGCKAPIAVPRLPVVNVSVGSARAYARWSNKRLPTALEWERAARGVQGAPFPWGDAEDPALANVSNNSTLARHALMPARSFAAYPALQMVGNAWEMVEGEVQPDAAAASKFDAPGEDWISIRGGSYNVPLTPDILYNSVPIPESHTAPDIGFRCVKDP